MSDFKIARVTGLCALGCVALTWAQFPLWTVGAAPPVYDGSGFARHLFDIQHIALTRILLDQGIYVCMMIFAAGFSHLVGRAKPESEWLGMLTFGAAAVWLGVTLVADGLEGGAVLDTLRGRADPSVVRALVQGTILIYNGSIAFAITGLFLGAAGWATFDSSVLPRWTGWIAYMAAASCAASIPAMYLGPVNPAGFYNPGGWGSAIIANFPPLIWFLIVGIILVRKSAADKFRNRFVPPPSEGATWG